MKEEDHQGRHVEVFPPIKISFNLDNRYDEWGIAPYGRSEC